MTYEPTKEDVERAVKLWCKMAGLKISKSSSKRETPVAHYLHAILRDHYHALAERGVFVAEWQPIKTAPKGGEHPYSRQIEDRSTFIVAWNGHHAGVGWGQIELGELLWWDETGEPITPKPTHWMPLPPEPKP